MKGEYLEKIFCKELNSEIRAFIGKDNINILQQNATEFIIPPGMEYRPDKIAAYNLGNEYFGWVIDLTNNFTNGIKEYTLYRKILIPSIDSINALIGEN